MYFAVRHSSRSPYSMPSLALIPFRPSIPTRRKKPSKGPASDTFRSMYCSRLVSPSNPLILSAFCLPPISLIHPTIYHGFPSFIVTFPRQLIQTGFPSADIQRYILLCVVRSPLVRISNSFSSPIMSSG